MAYSNVIKKRQGKSLAFDCVTTTRQLQQSLTVYTQVCIWTNNRVMLQKTMKESWSSILNRSTNKIYVGRQGTVISYIHEVNYFTLRTTRFLTSRTEAVTTVFPPPSIWILEFHISNILMATLNAPKTFRYKTKAL